MLSSPLRAPRVLPSLFVTLLVILTLSLTAVAGSGAAARSWPHAPKTDVNYAFGGASTGAINATALFAPELAGAVAAVGLALFGLDVELEFALQTLDDVDSSADVFWVWAGLNDYLAGGADPTIAPGRLVAALETLYDRADARIFVVPNLFRAGMIPLAQSLPPGAAAGLDALSGAHNAILAGALAQFAATHPDAVVVPVDVFSLFESLASNPAFTNLTDSCVDVGLPAGESCDGWLFFDTVHPTSAAMSYVAMAAADATLAALDGAPIRRVITIGDSFSDTGMFFDTVLRATGTGFPSVPPFYAGRFADGPNALDQFETLIGAEYTTSRFAQPLRATVVAEADWFTTHGSIDRAGEFFVRRTIEAADAHFATLRLGRTRCFYAADGTGDTLSLWHCTGNVRAGDRVAATGAELTLWGCGDDSVSVDLFYY